MAYFNQSSVFSTDKAILAFTEGNIANISVSVPNTFVGLNSDNRFIVPEGLFVAQVGNAFRFLPRAITSTAVSTGANTLTISPYNIFVPGDVLQVLQPYSILTITTVTAAQTVTVTVDGFTSTTTATTSNTTTTATQVAASINAAVGLRDRVYAISSANLVYIFPDDAYTSYGITTAGTVTTAALNNSRLTVNTTPIGTILSVNSATGVVTLTGNAGVAVPVGTSVGLFVDDILGLHVHSVDYTIAPVKSLALYTQASGVRKQYLPYFDGDIQRRFPKILFADKF